VRELLAAYVDDELPPARAAAVAGHLTACRECSAAYEAMLTTVATLQEALVHYPAPDTLRVRVRASLRDAMKHQIALRDALPDTDAAPLVGEPAGAPLARPDARRRPRAWWGWGVAASLTLAALSSGATLLATRAWQGGARVQEEVLASHIRSLMPDHLTDVRSNDQHNVKPWFNGRLDFSPAVARLDAEGFPLLGGRVDYLGGRPVAVVVYGRRQHVINAFSWPTGDGDAGTTAASSRGYHALRWREGGLEHWVVSDLNAAELEQFVGLLRRAPR
jgi:anti-sigma factor RsiW